jgi:hypothetical protein
MLNAFVNRKERQNHARRAFSNQQVSTVNGKRSQQIMSDSASLFEWSLTSLPKAINKIIDF